MTATLAICLALLAPARADDRPHLVFSLPSRATYYSYAEGYRGKLMANGHVFIESAMTCATWLWPLGTHLRVTCEGRSVDVTVTDRGPARRIAAQGVLIDLSKGAYDQLRPGDKTVHIQPL